MINAFYDMLNRLGYHHPAHPPTVHMPIGLVIGAFIFLVIALIFRRRGLVPTHRHCAILAFVLAFPVIALGIMDWQHYYHGALIQPIRVKLVMAPILVALLGISIALGRGQGRSSLRALPFYFLSVCAVVVLGYYGGQLTYAGRTIAGPPRYLAGQRVYAASCAACHPDGGNILDPRKPVLHSGLLENEDIFKTWVRDPAPPMPPSPPSQIPDPQVKELYDYIQNVLNK
jgi:uncharacterized membrane protein